MHLTQFLWLSLNGNYTDLTMLDFVNLTQLRSLLNLIKSVEMCRVFCVKFSVFHYVLNFQF